MRESYTEPKIEVIQIQAEDVIMTSGGGSTPDPAQGPEIGM